MSRLTLHIDRLVLKGFDSTDANALAKALESELSRVLADPRARAEWARPHRTPVLKLGHMALEPGAAGARKFGGGLARAVGKGLKP